MKIEGKSERLYGKGMMSLEIYINHNRKCKENLHKYCIGWIFYKYVCKLAILDVELPIIVCIFAGARYKFVSDCCYFAKYTS